MQNANRQDVEEWEARVNIPGERLSVFEDLTRDTGYDAGNRDEEVDDQCGATGSWEQGCNDKGHGGLDMRPDNEKNDYDGGVSSEDELGRDGNASEAEEEAKNHLHRKELEIMSQIVGEWPKAVLKVSKRND